MTPRLIRVNYVRRLPFRQRWNAALALGVVSHLALEIFRRLVLTRLGQGLSSPFSLRISLPSLAFDRKD